MTVTYSTPLSPALGALLNSVDETTPITTEDVTHTADGVEFGGFLAAPVGAKDTRMPAVLLFHDWTGLSDHVKVRAQLLARLGYVALAGDIYGGAERFDGDAASAEAGKYYGDPALFRARAAANLEYLRSRPEVDADRIVVLGYCFGGSAALEVARAGERVAGVVSFHGALATGAPAERGAVQAPVLILTGANDPVVPDAAVTGLMDEFRAADVADWQLVVYSGAMHAFTMPDENSPEYGAAYNDTANRRSWAALLAFLDVVFA